ARDLLDDQRAARGKLVLDAVQDQRERALVDEDEDVALGVHGLLGRPLPRPPVEQGRVQLLALQTPQRPAHSPSVQFARCRSRSSWWRTVARSRFGSSAPVARSGSRPSRSSPPTMPARCTPGARTRSTSADAIHPGYGFLAESPDFAEAVEAASLRFVGPSPEALRAGGDKLAAK